MRKKILVSGCLYGDHIVRYDDGSVPLCDPIFLHWKAEGRFIPICPEVFGGLPTPRPDARRKDGGVFTRTGACVTAEYTKGAVEALRLAREYDVAFAIMKENSPSCGSKQIYGTFTGAKTPGNGLAAEYLKNAGFTVFDENEITEAATLLAKIEG
jgi:uncharacterized protein YbbK (DUF523 family)